MSTLETIDITLIREWLGAMHLRQNSKATVARRGSTLRTFFTWAQDEELIIDNPTRGMSTPKRDRHLPSVLSQAQMNQLLDELQQRHRQNPTDARLLRLWAVVEVLYASGMRISELTGLDLHSVDRANRTVRVLGKGNKERIVPLGVPAMKALNRWVAHGRPQWIPEGSRNVTALFIGPRGRRANPGRCVKTSAGYCAPLRILKLPVRTCCVIPRQRTWLMAAPISAPCRNSWGIPHLRPHRSTLMSP